MKLIPIPRLRNRSELSELLENNMATRKREEHCDYCGKSNRECGALVTGEARKDQGKDTSFICEGCVTLVQRVIEADEKKSKKKSDRLTFEEFRKTIPSPKQIVGHLDLHVIGQEKAKKHLSVACHDHYIRLYSIDDGDEEVEIEKSNVLLVGPTGSGKTLLCRVLANFLNVPFAIGDATSVTEAGYVGEDVENLLLKLLREADFDIPLAEKGMMMIDELDKIRRSGGNVSITRDVSGEGVQQSLLKMLEGTTMNIPPQGGRKHPEQQFIEMDTKDILFICAGTFTDINAIIRKRMNKKAIGFGAESIEEAEKRDEWIMQHMTNDDLVEFGMIPELIGRIPVIAPLKELSLGDLCHVLTEPKNSLIRQQKKLVGIYGHKLTFTDGAIEEIAREALKRKTGARGLRGVIEEIMLPLKYNLPEQDHQSIEITEAVIKGDEQVFPDKEAA
jgi:ATP-dependent Clp protease ATP-binding subunit ClpX